MKIKLKLDTLSVESFETDRDAHERSWDGASQAPSSAPQPYASSIK